MMTPEFELHFIFLLAMKTFVKYLFKSFIIFFYFLKIDLRSYPFVSDVNIANIVSYAMDCLFMFKSRSLL